MKIEDNNYAIEYYNEDGDLMFENIYAYSCEEAEELARKLYGETAEVVGEIEVTIEWKEEKETIH